MIARPLLAAALLAAGLIVLASPPAAAGETWIVIGCRTSGSGPAQNPGITHPSELSCTRTIDDLRHALADTLQVPVSAVIARTPWHCREWSGSRAEAERLAPEWCKGKVHGN